MFLAVLVQIFRLICKCFICVFSKATCHTDNNSRVGFSCLFSSSQVLHRFPVRSPADRGRHRGDGEGWSGESCGLHTVSSVQLLDHRWQRRHMYQRLKTITPCHSELNGKSDKKTNFKIKKRREDVFGRYCHHTQSAIHPLNPLPSAHSSTAGVHSSSWKQEASKGLKQNLRLFE